MDTLEIYGFEDGDGHEPLYTTRDIAEAKEYARRRSLKLIAYIFEFSDSELVEDNTPSRRRRRR